MEQIMQEDNWYYYVWERLGNADFKKDFRENYEAVGYSFVDLVRELESWYGPIIPRNTIIEKQGDILSSNLTGCDIIICHQVNCLGVMGAGLAKQMREKFPMMYLEYKRLCYNTADKKTLLGEVLTHSIVYNGYEYTIANLFGQEQIGTSRCYTDYDALRKALQTVRCIASPLPGRAAWRVRIPYKMGCGLAGGDWNIVRAIVQEELVDHGIIVEVWKL